MKDWPEEIELRATTKGNGNGHATADAFAFIPDSGKTICRMEIDPESIDDRLAFAQEVAKKIGRPEAAEWAAGRVVEEIPGWKEKIGKPEPFIRGRVWKKTREKIRNVRDGTYKDKKTGEECDGRYYVQMDEIAKELRRITGEWPRQASKILFAIIEQNVLPTVVWFKTTDQLFAWISSVCDFQWESGAVVHPETFDTLTPPTKGEFLEYLRNNPARSYDAVEKLPHQPPLNDLFYMPFPLPELPTSGETPLQTLVQRFNPDSEIDRQLMMAALLTPGWGGPPGARPAFVFCSEHGRGTGKTVTATVLSELWGGAVGITVNEDWEKAKGRLLGNEAMTQRIVFIDNIKGKLHGSEIEGLITCNRIDGWKPYHGGASRPNLMTWYLTSNVPSLSQDLAERSVIIRVGKKKHSDNFKEWAEGFIRQHRSAIIAELLEILRGQPLCTIEKENRDRWGSWQDAILTRWDNGNEVAAEIIARRPGVDADIDEANEIAAAVQSLVSSKFIDYERRVVRITRKQMLDAFVSAGLAEKKTNVKWVTTVVKDKLGLGALRCLHMKKTEEDRFWIYTGMDADPDRDEEPLIT